MWWLALRKTEWVTILVANATNMNSSVTVINILWLKIIHNIRNHQTKMWTRDFDFFI